MPESRLLRAMPESSRRDHLPQVRLLAQAGQVAWMSGRIADAASIYSGLCALAPNDPLGFVGLAEAHLFHRRFGEAEQSARRAIHAQGCNRSMMAYAYKLLARALAGQRQESAAIDAVQRVCELDPDGLGAELAREWSRMGGGIRSLNTEPAAPRQGTASRKGSRS